MDQGAEAVSGLVLHCGILYLLTKAELPQLSPLRVGSEEFIFCLTVSFTIFKHTMV